MLVPSPAGPLATNITVYVPTVEYVWAKTAAAAVFVELVSPKSQNRLVIDPVEVSVKVTPKGAVPEIGTAMKLADGGAGVPETSNFTRPAVLVLTTYAK